jgi:hypothetical protein
VLVACLAAHSPTRACIARAWRVFLLPLLWVARVWQGQYVLLLRCS